MSFGIVKNLSRCDKAGLDAPAVRESLDAGHVSKTVLKTTDGGAAIIREFIGLAGAVVYAAASAKRTA